MAGYIKQTWTDRDVERPSTYNMVDNGDGTYTLVPSEGTIYEAGTPIIAATMNHMEDGIKSNADDLNQEISDRTIADSNIQSELDAHEANLTIHYPTSAITKTTVGLENVVNEEQMPLTGGIFTGPVTAAPGVTPTQIRNITISNSAPTGGQDGYIWIQYV